MSNISDPYRWLEKDSIRTRKWIHAQERQTEKYFAKAGSKSRLNKRYRELLDIEVENLPVARGRDYFFRRRNRGEDQAKLFLKHGLKGKPILLIDPNKLKLGTIHNWDVSKDSKYIVVEFSLSSNDRCVIKVLDVGKRAFLKDTITSERYPNFQTWNHDSSGFWYSRGEGRHSITEEKYFKKIYYHTLGQSTKEDKLFFGEELAKDDWPGMNCSHNGKFQIINVVHNDKTTTVYFRDALDPDAKFVNITKKIKSLSFAQAEGGYIYLLTDYNAPNCKILRRQILDSSLGKWKVFVPESRFKLSDFVLLKKNLVLEYIENISSRAYLLNLSTREKVNIKLSSLGSIGAFSAEYEGHELFFNFSSLNIAGHIYRFDLKTLERSLYWKADVRLPSGLELRQEWTVSKDGTKIPMFILKNKDNIRLSPTLVYAYGGFGISLLPGFRSSVIPFIEGGGIFVLANIRGGEEFGKEWHEAIIKNRQHKKFEDFAAVLRYLVDKKYTTQEKLCVWGGSNGGLLMSVMALRYPTLFRAALIDVPVTDMLRFHLFHGGRLWFHDYGDPGDKKIRKYLLSYSPYHNVGKENYPAMMFITAEHDDRVHPMHTYKFFARLKANHRQKNTLLLKIEKKAGHGGAGKIKSTINELTDMFSFVFRELGISIA